jgi:hypothetical protein
VTGLARSRLPGLLVIQLDGVSHEALQLGLRRGPMPTVRELIERGSHRLSGWHLGAPAQTSSSQAAILYGDDFDIPSFRWYEKDRGRLMVSNHPADAGEIDRRLAARRGGHDGPNGLLAHHGASIGNLVTGGAPRSVLTMGTLTSEVRGTELWRTMFEPRFFARELTLMAREMAIEVGQGARQRVRGHRPRVKRGGSFPFLRAISNVLVRDLTTRLVRGELAAAVPSIYASYVGYDVVAHHAGPFSPDALRVLSDLDREILRLIRASRLSPRTYDVVILSDHGQTPGSTFRQRFGERLEEVVQGLADGRSVSGDRGTTETWGYLNQVLSGAVASERRGARRARRALALRMRDGYVEVGPDRYAARAVGSDIVVCTAGNLAHIYLALHPGRLTLDQIRAAAPGLVEGLVDHPGLDFVLGLAASDVPVALGRRGFHNLATGEVDGDDPLAKFAPGTPAALRRLSEFPHAGDLILNGRYDAANETVAAFEELAGSHGGLGGPQGNAFVLTPRGWMIPEVIEGGVGVYALLEEHVPQE